MIRTMNSMQLHELQRKAFSADDLDPDLPPKGCSRELWSRILGQRMQVDVVNRLADAPGDACENEGRPPLSKGRGESARRRGKKRQHDAGGG